MIFESFFAFLSRVFFFTSYVNDKGSFPQPLSKEDERLHLTNYKDNNDQASKELLIKHNLRLVVFIAKKYNSSNAEADDLLSIGSIGLIKAINSYEFEKGSTLSTYAARCIENEILMYLRTNKRHIGTTSLYEAIGKDKDGNEIIRMDTIPAKTESIEMEIETKLMYEKVVKDMIVLLSDREQQIITMRFGLDGNKPLTQIDVAEQLNICRSYVSRIEKKAIKKLHQIAIKDDFKRK